MMVVCAGHVACGMWHVWGKCTCIYTQFGWGKLEETDRPLERLGRCEKEDGSPGTSLMRLRSEMNGGFL